LALIRRKSTLRAFGVIVCIENVHLTNSHMASALGELQNDSQGKARYGKDLDWTDSVGHRSPGESNWVGSRSMSDPVGSKSNGNLYDIWTQRQQSAVNSEQYEINAQQSWKWSPPRERLRTTRYSSRRPAPPSPGLARQWFLKACNAQSRYQKLNTIHLGTRQCARIRRRRRKLRDITDCAVNTPP